MAELVIVVVFIAVFVLAIRAERKRQERVAATWAAVAERLGGDFIPGEQRFWGPGSPASITATIDAIDVEVDTFTRGSGKNKRTYTRVRAAATAPKEVSMKVYGEHAFSGLARAVGFQDVEIGDAEFDDAFMIKASDEVFAKEWLNRTVRKRISRAGDYAYQLKGGRVTAELAGVDEDGRRLAAAMSAVAAFADGRHHVVRELRKLAKQLRGKAKKEPRRWASLRADVDGVPVTVDTLEHGTTHFNVATAQVVGAKLTPLVITNDPHEFSPTLPAAEMPDLPAGYGAWTVDPQRAAAQLTESVKKSIRDLQPIKLRVDDERVRVYLVGICPPVAEMHAAVKLAATIAAGASAGPYR